MEEYSKAKDLVKIMEDVERYNQRYKESMYFNPIKLYVGYVMEGEDDFGDKSTQIWDIDINQIKKKLKR